MPKASGHVFSHRPDAHYLEYCAVGPPEKVGDLIRKYFAAGASKFVVRPMCDEWKVHEQLELFGRHVLPQFHG